jgi:hypothetical protein
VTDANGCTSSANVTITQPNVLSASASVSAPILCNGGNATVAVSAIGGTAPFAGVGNFIASAGTQSYTVTDANGCIAQTNITVNQPSVLSANSAVSQPILCFGGTGQITISAIGGTFPYVGTGIQMHSTNNADTQQVVIEGLDENFLMKSWTGNLNGTGYVNAIGKWARVFGAYNNSSTSFIGTVNIHPSGNVSSNYSLINANDNQSLMAVYTIPANYTGYLVAYGMSAHNAVSSSSIGYNIKIKTREFGKAFRTQASNSFGTEESIERFLSFPIKLPPKTDIKFDIVSANGNNGSVDAEFSIALVN